MKRAIYLYEDVYSVIVTDKKLNLIVIGLFKDVIDAENYINDNNIDYWYFLDKDLVNESQYCWNGEDYENHIIEL